MRTSLREIEQIERYLNGRLSTGETLLFEARAIVDPEQQEKTGWQQHSYEVIRQYGRQQLKGELEQAHQKLFKDPTHWRFREKIRRLFNKR